MIEAKITVYCDCPQHDFDCREYLELLDIETSELARIQGHYVGWRRQKDKDICPKCVPHTRGRLR